MALQDRLDQLRAQEGQADKTPDVAPADAVALRQVLQRPRAASGQVGLAEAAARWMHNATIRGLERLLVRVAMA